MQLYDISIELEKIRCVKIQSDYIAAFNAGTSSYFRNYLLYKPCKTLMSDLRVFSGSDVHPKTKLTS